MTAEPVELVRAPARDDLEWAEALLDAPVEQPAVRVALYCTTAVVLGCGQRPTARDRLRATAAGIDLLVRRSGGGAVLAGPWLLGASIALPAWHPLAALPLPASYRWLGEACVRWLDGLGIAAESLPAEPGASAGAEWACFGRTSWWEVQAAGRKIAGFAQMRRRHGVLYTAGALLAPPPWPLMCAVLGKPHEEAVALAAGTVSCEQLVAHPLCAEWAAAAWCESLVSALDRATTSAPRAAT